MLLLKMGYRQSLSGLSPDLGNTVVLRSSHYHITILDLGCGPRCRREMHLSVPTLSHLENVKFGRTGISTFGFGLETTENNNERVDYI